MSEAAMYCCTLFTPLSSQHAGIDGAREKTFLLLDHGFLEDGLQDETIEPNPMSMTENTTLTLSHIVDS
jgi:hypothetical protein